MKQLQDIDASIKLHQNKTCAIYLTKCNMGLLKKSTGTIMHTIYCGNHTQLEYSIHLRTKCRNCGCKFNNSMSNVVSLSCALN